MKFNVSWSKKHVNLARRLKNSILRFRFPKILDFEKSNIFFKIFQPNSEQNALV